MKKLLIALLSVVFLLSIFTGCGNSGEKLVWSDIALSNILPAPESDRAEIYTNSNNELRIYIFKTTEKQYNDYVKSCVAQGFTIDSEEIGTSYSAYNQEGYKLDLSYYSSKEEMHIMLETPMEMSEIQWPTSEMAKMIPIPKSNIGNVLWENESGFVIYIGNTPISDYNEYVQVCSDIGFNVDYKKGEDYYEAYNENGYRLSLDYEGYNIMFVRVDAPEDENEKVENTEASMEQPTASTFKVQIEINCTENLMFSKYDIDVFVDEIKIGTIEHGKSNTFQVELEEGNHSLIVTEEENPDVDGTVDFTVSGEMELNYEVYCTSDQVEIESVEDQVAASDTENENGSESESENEPESDVEENFTVDNCEELAVMLSIEDYSIFITFAEKYDGRIIEFDGRIDYLANNEDYNTRYDILVSAGDYDPDTQSGPTFKFENVNVIDLDLDTLYLEDEIWVGRNVHIIAEVVSFNDDTGIFYLDPVSVTGR